MNLEKETDYCIRFGHSLWSVNQLPAQEVKIMAIVTLSVRFYSSRDKLNFDEERKTAGTTWAETTKP